RPVLGLALEQPQHVQPGAESGTKAAAKIGGRTERHAIEKHSGGAPQRANSEKWLSPRPLHPLRLLPLRLLPPAADRLRQAPLAVRSTAASILPTLKSRRAPPRFARPCRSTRSAGSPRRRTPEPASPRDQAPP